MTTYVRRGRTHYEAWRYGQGTPNGQVVDNPQVSTEVHTSTDTRSGTKNPGWRDKIRLSVQAGTPYSRAAETYGFVTGIISGTYFENQLHTARAEEKLTGELLLGNHPGLPPLPSFPTLDISARTKFLSKCRSTQRKFQGGVFLGELSEAIRMIVRPGAALRRGISAYLANAKKASRRASFTDRGRILTKTWLEYSYGWRPLFKDIDDGISALANVNHLIPVVLAGVAGDQSQNGRFSQSSGVSGSKLRVETAFQNVNRGSVRYLGCVGWESDDQAARNWRSNWGLTLSDFLPTVWNLIPYSFIVDYFSNVGAVIDASSFGVVALRWGVRSTVLSASVQMFTGPAFIIPGPSVWQPNAHASLSLSQLSRWSFNRALVTQVGVGINDLHFRIPGVSDWRKWANLSALAIERLY